MFIFGWIYNGEEMIDEVFVSFFWVLYFYIGEDSIEIICYGLFYIL